MAYFKCWILLPFYGYRYLFCKRKASSAKTTYVPPKSASLTPTTKKLQESEWKESEKISGKLVKLKVFRQGVLFQQ